MRSIANVILVWSAIWITGCSNLTSEYGNSKGISGRQSLNGFGALRRAYEVSGFTTRDVTRLTERVRRSEVIVWTPQEYGPIPSDVTQWFDLWLGQGNRTLVYVVPDSGSEVDYWRDASKLAPPVQRLEYRKQAARATNQRATWRLNRQAIPSNGWFVVSPSITRQVSNEFSDDWADTWAGDSATPFTTELKLSAYQAVASQTTAATPTAALAGINGVAANGPNSIGVTVATTTASDTEVKFQSVVKNVRGDPVVALIESQRWKQSQVIVVAGGSLLTNFALTREIGRDLAKQIIDQSLKNTVSGSTDLPQAGFLTTDWRGVSISQRKPGAPGASGMELLTVWPISIVTIHGVLLGLVVCLMLFPIFGRPRRLRRVDHSDFGDHLDAVAALMNKAGGEAFARQRISDYFKRIRQENSGPWVLPDTAEHASFTMHRSSSKPPPVATPNRTSTPE